MSSGEKASSMRLFLALCLLLAMPVLAAPKGVTEKKLPAIGGVPVYQWTYPSGSLKVKGLLFLPVSKEPLPLVLFNHDGHSGISKEHKMASARLAKQGYAVFAPSYRGEDGSQGIVEVAAGEVQDVLNAVPLLAQVKGIDAERLAFVGASHGALISVLAAAGNPQVDAVVEAYGVMDIYTWYDYLSGLGKIGKDEITLRAYGNGPKTDPAKFQARYALARAPKINAPVLILQGAKDELVPPDQARVFKAELEKHGKSVKMKIYPNCLHGFLVYVPYLTKGVEPEERTETELAWREMLAFLKEHLKK